MPQIVLAPEQRDTSSLKRAGGIAVAVVVFVIVVWVLLALLAWQKHRSVVSQEAQYEATGNVSGEITLLTNYLNSKPPKQYRYDIAVKLGDVAFSQKQYAAAAEWYFQAYRINGSDLQVVLRLAQSSAGIGDKATAVAYYRKAITLTPPSDTQQVAADQNAIRALGDRP